MGRRQVHWGEALGRKARRERWPVYQIVEWEVTVGIEVQVEDGRRRAVRQVFERQKQPVGIERPIRVQQPAGVETPVRVKVTAGWKGFAVGQVERQVPVRVEIDDRKTRLLAITRRLAVQA